MRYNELVERYGSDNAYDMLLMIEREANIHSSIAGITDDDDLAREVRLQKALQALNKVNYLN
ncbi:MAG: hypothetical protein GC131_04465 [Alphaproteobacteria bacterium]|nr:hypothetical protein [Alphaproteobacteria bacterium]